jgi:protein-disulfide isomerase
MRAWIVGASLLACVPAGNAQARQGNKPATAIAKAGDTTKLPTEAEVNTALTRSLGYDPAATWKIVYIAPSDVPGISNVVVLLNNKDYESFYVLPSGQKAIKGEMVPFGPDPFAENRKKLLAAHGPARGADKPVISMVEFSDLQCPHCKTAQPTVEKLAADFPQMRYVFQNFPLPMHPWAMKAAGYADCAAQQNPDAFWKYVDSIFENQGGIAEATADNKLKELGAAAGLDAQKLSSCAALPATAARIDKSVVLGKSLGVQGTPTVFINGRKLPGLGGLNYDQLKALVQFEIAHAGK